MTPYRQEPIKKEQVTSMLGVMKHCRDFYGRGNDVRYPNKASLFADTAIHVTPYLGTLCHFLYHTP